MDLSWLTGVPDFVIDYLVQIVFALFVAFILPPALSLLKIKADDSRRVVIEAAIQNGLKWAITQAIAKAAQSGSAGRVNTPQALLTHSESREAIVQNAKAYVVDGTAKSLKRLKVDDALLTQRIEARLPDAAVEGIKSAHEARLL